MNFETAGFQFGYSWKENPNSTATHMGDTSHGLRHLSRCYLSLFCLLTMVSTSLAGEDQPQQSKIRSKLVEAIWRAVSPKPVSKQQTEPDKTNRTIVNHDMLLAGTWTVLSVECGGKPADAPIETIEFESVKNKWKCRWDKKARQSVSLDISKKPKHIDFRGPDGTFTGLGIYKIEGHKLTICMGVYALRRPTGFVTEPKDYSVLIVFRRGGR